MHAWTTAVVILSGSVCVLAMGSCMRLSAGRRVAVGRRAIELPPAAHLAVEDD
jgi:hypothetical protein